ncbi:MAG: hypothetical protein AAGF28_05530 [Pseudomonadota bacterium]
MRAIKAQAKPAPDTTGVFAIFTLGIVLTIWLFAMTCPANASDSHANYYYPEPQTSEVYVSSLDVLPNADKRTRAGFTVALGVQQRKLPYPPNYHAFAKGAEAEKLIIVATGPNHYDTLFRLRALLAAMTAQARTSPLFQQAQNPEDLNFLDIAKLTGFTKVTISDGDKIAHRIEIR